jgi:UDP-N-acetylmuramate dehydrogenase
MGVGGPARWFIEVDRREALPPLLDLLRASGVRWMILGGGSNTLFDDAGYEGAVVHLGREFRFLEKTDLPNAIRAGAAANLSAVMNFARRNGLAGLEFCAGIPGNLGGALAGNAGTAAGEICALAETVEVLDGDLQPAVRRRGEFAFAYRKSDLAGDVILAATLRLRPDAPDAIEARIQQALAKRLEQPVGERSSGCMFKNPPGDYAGRLIDRAGLKGLRVGGACVSDLHANFMLNDGTATTADVLGLMSEVRARVLAQTGVALETEVRAVPYRPGDGISKE